MNARRPVVACGLSLCLLGSLDAARAAPQPLADPALASLPSVIDGARPGPPVLYAAPPVAPELENHSPQFKAAPLLVSGTEAYVKGEYLYQDFLYDDHGADTNGSAGGDVTYPTDVARYANNVADLVEFRISALKDAVAYRFTFGSMTRPDDVIAALAFDTDRNAATGSSTLPLDPGAPFPGTDEVITTWGSGAVHSTLRAGRLAVTQPVRSHVDIAAHQITVIVPRSVSNPHGAWRTTVVTGLHDHTTGGWLKPATSATATTPGGAGASSPSGIFNEAFRFTEPVLTSANQVPDNAQATALRNGTPTAFAHDIEFGLLDHKVVRTTVPRNGTQMRIFPSRLSLGQGYDGYRFPEYRGRLQPYFLYVPSTYRAGRAAPFTLDLHSLGDTYTQYVGTKGVQQMGEQRGSLLATPLGRGPDGWYRHESEFDTFEVWNDVARHFDLDPARTALTGYSMGGFGSYWLGTLYPDLFGRAMTVVGTPGEGVWVAPLPPWEGGSGTQTVGPPNYAGMESLTNLWLENARNLPYLNVVAGQDELNNYRGAVQQNLGDPSMGVRGFDQLGYRFEFVTYQPAEHLTLAGLSYDIPMAAAFLGDAQVERDPTHVSFGYFPAADDGKLGLRHDHAYWISGVQLADPSPHPDAYSALLASPSSGYLNDASGLASAQVDAVTHGTGRGDPASASTVNAGVGPLPWHSEGRTWGPIPTTPRRNGLTLKLTNVGRVRIALNRAHLDLSRALQLDVTSTTASTLVLTSTRWTRTVHLRAGGTSLTLPAH
jgi:hypothetical protein